MPNFFTSTFSSLSSYLRPLLDLLTKLYNKVGRGLFKTTTPGIPCEGALASCKETRTRKEQAAAGGRAGVKGASGKRTYFVEGWRPG